MFLRQICMKYRRKASLIAVSSAATSTLVVDADEIPQYIEGIIEGLGGVDEAARRGRWNGY